MYIYIISNHTVKVNNKKRYRIKGITVEIGGDATKLSKSLKGVNKNIKNSQKQKLLAESISATKEKLATLKTATEQANIALANGEITQKQYDALQRKIIETEQELRNLEREANKASDSLQKIGATGELLQNVGDKISEVGTTLTTKVTVSNRRL